MAGVLLKELQHCYTKFDAENIIKKKALLNKIKVDQLSAKQLLLFHNLLLFLLAYASDEKMRSMVEKKLEQISRCIKSNEELKVKLCNSGLPFTSTIASFSFDAIQYLFEHRHCALSYHSSADPAIPLRTVLQHSLPSIERDEALEYDDDNTFLKTIHIGEQEKTDFIIGEFLNMSCPTKLKDKEWQSLKMFFEIKFTDKLFSLSFNRMDNVDFFYHKEISKNIDKQKIMSTRLPKPKKLTEKEMDKLTDVIKKTMVLYVRETDPSTYLEIKSLKYYTLERGLSIALFGMSEERQLPLESYIGYTLFKNGIPISYGGSWVFGAYARFGINVFDPYRGGESELIMAQLLRTYSQVFNLKTIEIESYQIGNNNEDGIKSGAYWFYYKFGFRSNTVELLTLGENEYEKIKKDKNYRTPEKKLLTLANANMTLSFDGRQHPYIIGYTKGLSLWLKNNFNGSRYRAVKESRLLLMKDLGINDQHKLCKCVSFEEWSLIYGFKYKGNIEALHLIKELILLKSKDAYKYNRVLTQLLAMS